MVYYLNEIDSIQLLNEIRVRAFAPMASDRKTVDQKLTMYSKIKIEKINNLWNQLEFEVTVPEDSTLVSIYEPCFFSLSLTNETNSDKLVIADSHTQERNESNIYDVIYFFYNDVWCPVAKGQLTLTEQEWKGLMPDSFNLVSSGENLEPINYQTLEKCWNFVLKDKTLSNLLYERFFLGCQPITVYDTEFVDFCNMYKVPLR